MTWVKCNLNQCKYNSNGTCQRIATHIKNGFCSMIYNEQGQVRPNHLWEGPYEGKPDNSEQ